MRASFLFLLLAAPLAACSSGSSGGSVDPQSAAPVAQADFCTKYASTVCGILVPCCNSSGFATDTGTCQTQFQSYCQTNVLKQPTGTTYDAKNAGVCIATIQASVNNCSENKDPALQSSEASCSHIFVGSVAIGGPCSTSSQCAPSPSGSVVCVRSGTATTGTCTLQKQANAGEACGSVSGGYVSCVSTTYCKYDTTTTKQTCAPRAGKGAACDPLFYNSCADGLTCNATSKTCTDPANVGEACSTTSSSACVSTAYCDTTAKLCVAKKANGAACTFGSQCATGSCKGGVCAENTIVSADVCAGKLGGSSSGGSTDAGAPPSP